MDKKECITKYEAILQDNSVYQHLSKDTSPTIYKELIKILQEYKKNNFISETEYTPTNPSWLQFPSSKISGLSKIHKNNMPMHHIVSACGTATHNTAKFITKTLQNYCDKTSSFVKDSTDFIKKIKHLSINPEEETVVSSDLSAFFTSIPLPVALQVINPKISTFTNFTNVYKIPTVKFIKLLEFTLNNYIFCFNKRFYKQLQGGIHGFTCLTCHYKYLHGILWILSHSLISNINQVVVQVCWWCSQCHLERSSQQTSRAPQFHRPTFQIHHTTPRNRWTPLPRYPDQIHS